MIRQVFAILLLLACTSCTIDAQSSKSNQLEKAANETETTTNEETMATTQFELATLGAGCFWCVEAIFQDLKGVESVKSGYTGGHIPNPTYKQVCGGYTGHAEVVQVKFDPSVISFAEILEVFWTTHDPTTLNRQGADVGTQYRSAIFYHSEEQKEIATKSMQEVATKIWDDPIVTKLSAASTFYDAEAYHQDYYSSNPYQGYCRVVITPKVTKFRKKFADKLKDDVK